MPVDSIITTTITMHMVTIGPRENWGMPNWNGSTNPTAGAEPTASKLILPIAAATTAPTTMPISTEIFATNPLPNLLTPRMASSTRSDRPNPPSASRFGFGIMPLKTPSTIFGTICGPSAQSTPTRISDTPMIRMIEPVTTAGNRRIRELMSGAATRAKTPAPMTAP